MKSVVFVLEVDSVNKRQRKKHLKKKGLYYLRHDNRIIVESEDGKEKIAEINENEIIPAIGYVVRIQPKYY